MVDPREVARTYGFMKYKLLKLVNSGRQAAMREQKDRTQFVNNLNKKCKCSIPIFRAHVVIFEKVHLQVCKFQNIF